MDRGYVCIETMVFCLLTNKKFIIRLDSRAYTKERSKITTNDEYIDFKYTKDRTAKRYFRDENLRQYARELKSSNLRIVTHTLNTGEVEQLITNLANKEMIRLGQGIIAVPVEKIGDYFTKLINYYETGDNTDLKNWLYETSIDGI